MKQHNYTHYLRVFKSDTKVTNLSNNDFIPVKPRQGIAYTLPVNDPLFYGCLNNAKALEMAKVGALQHINILIAKGRAGKLALYEYRFNHSQDLTVNLVKANILNTL